MATSPHLRTAPGMRERSPGVWELIVEGGNDPVTGKRRQVSRVFRGNLRDARKARAALLVDVAKGRHTGTAHIFQVEGQGPGAPKTAFNPGPTSGHDAGLEVSREARAVNLREGESYGGELDPGEDVGRDVAATIGQPVTIVLRHPPGHASSLAGSLASTND